MRKVLIFMFSFGFVFSMAFHSYGSPNVTLDDKSYTWIEKLAAVDLIKNEMNTQRPWSRREFVRLIVQAETNFKDRCSNKSTKICVMAQGYLDKLEKKFQSGLVDGGFRKGEPEKIRLIFLDQVRAEAQYMESPFRQMPRSNGIGTIIGSTNPLVSQKGGRHYADGFTTSLEISQRAKLSKYFSLSFRPQAEFLWRDNGTTDANFIVNELSAKFSYRRFEIQAGRDHMIFGAGKSGGTLFSFNSRPLDLVKISNDIPFRFPWVFKYIGDNKFSFFVANLGPEYIYSSAYLYGASWSFKPFRNFEMGLIHSIIVGGSGAPNIEVLDILSEFFFTRRNGGAVVGGANVAGHRFGLSFRLEIPQLRNSYFYYEGSFEDSGRMAPWKMLQQLIASQAGIYIPLLTKDGKHDLRIQYSHVPALFGRHNRWISGHTLNQLSRGIPYGPQTQSLQMTWGYQISDHIHLQSRLEYLNRGTDRYARPRNNRGGLGEIIKTADFPNEHAFLVEENLAWQLSDQMSLLSSVGYEYVKNRGFQQGLSDHNFKMGLVFKYKFGYEKAFY